MKETGGHWGLACVLQGAAADVKTSKAPWRRLFESPMRVVLGVCGSGAPRKSEETRVGGWTWTAGAPSGVRAGSGTE
jgi:hypothetical protein